MAKSASPLWLVTNGEAKTIAYIAAPPNNKPSPWNTVHLKIELAVECRGKCMYCEGRAADTSYFAVEHIKPKGLFPRLVLDWSNLGWACTRCNTNKGDYWTDLADLQLLNPYVDEPSDHLAHVGPLVVTANQSSRGTNTIRQCKLNRDELLYSKARKIEALDRVLQQWLSAKDQEIRDVLAEDVLALIDVEEEFAASLRAFAKTRGFDTSLVGGPLSEDAGEEPGAP